MDSGACAVCTMEAVERRRGKDLDSGRTAMAYSHPSDQHGTNARCCRRRVCFRLGISEQFHGWRRGSIGFRHLGHECHLWHARLRYGRAHLSSCQYQSAASPHRHSYVEGVARTRNPLAYSSRAWHPSDTGTPAIEEPSMADVKERLGVEIGECEIKITTQTGNVIVIPMD